MDNINVFQKFGIDKDKPEVAAALTHQSFLKENGIRGENYQKLEFLGDRVLNMIIASELYDKCVSGTDDIGYRFSELVSNNYCKGYCIALRTR